jgi:hypothetical protein
MVRSAASPAVGSDQSAEGIAYRRLWLAVLKRAFRDLRAPGRAVRREAREFLSSQESSLSVLAQLAGLSVRRVQDRARRAVERQLDD